jgi:hypothetical protein
MAAEIKNGVSSNVIRVPRFEAKHMVYMALCLAGTAAALHFFWQDLNLTLTRFQDHPLGTVTRKENIAQRRFEDRTLWVRLRRQSPVYSGDYIRTAELSTAVLALSRGELVELAGHTLIQLTESAEGPVIELAQGSLEADTGGGGLTIRSSGLSLRAGRDSVLNAASGEGGFEAGLAAGSAVFTAPGETRTLGAGDTVGLPQAGRRAVVLSPRPGAGFLNATGGPLTLSFAWKRIGFDPDQTLRLEIAEDRAFTHIRVSRDTPAQTLAVELENGQYYWRAYPSGHPLEGGVSGRLSLIDASPPELISPVMDEEFMFKTTRPELRFLWTSCAGAESYRVTVSANADMTLPLYQSQVQDSGGDSSSVIFSGFEGGTWYWQVRPEYPRNYEGTAQASRTGSFRIRRRETLPAPVQQLPAQQGSLYLDDKKGRAYFSWKQEVEAAWYTFLLSRHEDLSDPLIKERTGDNYFAYDLKDGKLAPGQYYWGVYQTDMDGSDSAPSAARGIIIMAASPEAAGETPRAAESGTPAETAPRPAETARPETPLPIEAARPAAVPPEAPAPAQPVPKPEMPPLPAPVNMQPAPGYVLTEAIIVRDRQVSFSWNAVPGASAYVFILYQAEDGGRREILRRNQSETGFTLTDLTVLDAGTFIWRVEPVSRAAEQKGEAGESRFTVSIAKTQASQGQESGVMFGNE